MRTFEVALAHLRVVALGFKRMAAGPPPVHLVRQPVAVVVPAVAFRLVDNNLSSGQLYLPAITVVQVLVITIPRPRATRCTDTLALAQALAFVHWQNKPLCIVDNPVAIVVQPVAKRLVVYYVSTRQLYYSIAVDQILVIAIPPSGAFAYRRQSIALALRSARYAERLQSAVVGIHQTVTVVVQPVTRLLCRIHIALT